MSESSDDVCDLTPEELKQYVKNAELRKEAETAANTQTQVANTTISVPNKTVTFNLQNCNNFTFNF